MSVFKEFHRMSGPESEAEKFYKDLMADSEIGLIIHQ